MAAAWTIVCFSSVDWMSHHQRPQLVMTELARAGHTVLYLDNIGSRMPRLGDFKRVINKVWCWMRSSATEQAPLSRLSIDSPLVVPLQQFRLIRTVAERSLMRRIRKRVQLDRPLIVWTYVSLPVVQQVAVALKADLLVYDWCDDVSELLLTDSTVHRARVRRWENDMARRADIVFTPSIELIRNRELKAENVFLVAHGTAPPTRDSPTWPALEALPRPRIGFLGAITRWTDLPLVASLARRRPDWSFIVAGPVQTKIDAVDSLQNVVLTGEVPHSEISGVLAAFDVGIIPYRRSAGIEAANPLKLLDYLAHGLPVVSVDIPGVRQFEQNVRLADGPDEFLVALEAAIRDDPNPNAQSFRTWKDCAEEMSAYLTRALAHKND